MCLPGDGPGPPLIGSITFFQMLVCALLMSSLQEDSAPHPAKMEVAQELATLSLDAAWPTASDAGRRAVEQHLASRCWLPDLSPPAVAADTSDVVSMGGAPLSPTAATLQRDLQRHAPEVSLVELRCLLLLLRVSYSRPASELATAAQRAEREMQVLVDGQQALALASSATAGSLLARFSCMVASSAVLAALSVQEPAVGGQGAAMNERLMEAMRIAEEALQSCLAAKRE